MNELPQIPASLAAHPEIELGILPSRSSKEQDRGRGRASIDVTELADELELNGLPSTSSSVSTPYPSRPGSTTGGYSRSPSPSARVVDALPPTDEGWRAYSFLFCAFIFEALVWALPFGYPVFQEFYLSPDGPYPNDQGIVTLTGTVCSGVAYMSPVVLYPILEKRPRWRRAFLYGGYVVMMAGMIGSAFAKSAGMLLLTQGVLYGVGASVSYAPVISYMTEWFVRRTGFAYGVLTAGTSVAGVVFPFIISTLLQRFGSKGTLWGLGAVLAVLIGALLPFITGRIPDPPKYNRREPNRHVAPKFDLSFAKKKIFWVFSVANFLQSFGHFVPTIFISLYASLVSPSSKTLGSLALALINLFAAFSRVGFGILTDNPRWTLPLVLPSCIGGSLAVVVLWGWVAGTERGLLGFACAFGLASGGWSSLWAGFVGQIGSESPAQAATLLGIFSFGRGLANVLVAPISTVLLKSQPIPNYGLDSYGPLIIFTGVSLLSGCIALFASGDTFRCRRRGSFQNEH